MVSKPVRVWCKIWWKIGKKNLPHSGGLKKKQKKVLAHELRVKNKLN